MRLKELHINNFKFFPKQDPKSPLLKIDGKNLLIYGENGSGKSTIYWALYTLLESSFKDTDTKVEKYFNKVGDSSLVNIHATKKHNAYIKAVLNGGAAPKEYIVSGDITTIQAIRANSAARESGMSSDFINYRALFKLHHAKHTSDNNLFSWFEDEILPYIRTDNTHTFVEVLKQLRVGPRKVQNLAGETVFANSALATAANLAEQKDYKFYKQWDRKINAWKKGLTIFLKKINERANEILEQDFKQPIEIKLELIPPKHGVNPNPIIPTQPLQNLNWIEPEIRIQIVKYQGKKNAIKRPHSFLNEAKWTAIGLSIRLSILEDTTYRPSPVDLKILVLDDVLLNLDMSNRDIVTKYVLDNLTTDYQVILSTCDRSYFNWVRNELENSGQLEDTGNWKVYEMYVDEKMNGTQTFEFPKIMQSGDELTIAVSHFKAHDYAASANYLRKYAETLLCSWLPKVCWEDNQDRIKNNTKIALYNIVENGLNVFWSSFGIQCNEYKELRKYVRILLNPLSHADVGVERYKSEIKQIIEVLEKVKVLHAASNYTAIIAGGELVQVRLHNPATNQTFVGEYELSNTFYSLNYGGNHCYSSFKGKIVKCFPINADGTIPQEHILTNSSVKDMQTNYTDFQTKYTLTGLGNWMDSLYRTDGTKLI